jgi:hypothetical protein
MSAILELDADEATSAFSAAPASVVKRSYAESARSGGVFGLI